MKIIITGSNGQLGTDVSAELSAKGHEVIGADLPEADITNQDMISALIAESKADAVIHCAAFTNVDLAETEKELCKKINVDGTKNIATACKNNGIKMLYISTDYVFSGEGEEAFETDAPKAPCNFYGETKLGGEKAVTENCDKYFIVRISWVFGKNGKNFVKTMLRLSEDREEISVVCDQIGSPTYTKDLARLLCSMIETEKYGIYHATNMGECSWYEFALEIFKLAKLDVKVKPVTSDEYVTKAKRPFNSRMNKDKLKDNGFNLLPSWQDALKRYIYDELENSVEG